MRNLKRALSLGLTAAMISGLMVMGSSAASYADVTSEDNVEAIEVLEAVGIMIGDENGNFNPDQNVTRNEMAVVMSNLMEYNVASYKDTSPFTDVPSWAEPYVAACYTNGITAGYSDTIYGGSDTVTTAQAALMLMKALGYFQYASDFGGDWQLATTRQGNAIDLFVGVDSGVTQAMTRNDVAQLVLNTLRAGTVEASTDGSWSIGDVTINNNVTYSFITSNQTYATAIDDARSTSSTTDAGRSIVELGEQLYMGDLKLNDNATDVFGRPSRYWEYEGNEIGTYTKTELLRQEYTAEVTGRDLYDLLGKSIIDDYSFDIYVDGETEESVLGDAYFTKANLTRSNDDAVGETGNGVLTQVYQDIDTHEITIAVINTYLAQAEEDYDEKNEEVDLTVYHVQDKGTSRNAIFVKNGDEKKGDTTVAYTVESDEFDIASVVEDDLFLVTMADGAVQSMEAPEILADTTISNFRLEKYVTADGTQYDYADTVQYDPEVLDEYDDSNMKDITYNVILDPYGYMIGIEQNEDPDQYVFITGIEAGASNLYAKNVDANAIFLDGRMETITINMVKSDLEDSLALGRNLSQINTWCTYTVNSDNVYTVKEVAISGAANVINNDIDVAQYAQNVTGGTLEINTGHVSLKGADDRSIVYGNDDTVYLNAELDNVVVDDTTDDVDNDGIAGDYRWIISDVESVTTGVKNVNLEIENLTNKAVDGVSYYAPENEVYTLYGDDNYVIAAVTIGENAGTSSNYAYVTSSNVNREADNDGDDWTWTREVVVNGELVEISEVGESLEWIGNASKNQGEMTQGYWFEVKYDADDNVRRVESLQAELNDGDPLDGFINRVSNVEAAVEDDDTVLLADNTVTALTYKNGTLYTNASQTEGFSVSPDVKVVLALADKDGKPFDVVEDGYTGYTGLERALRNMNSQGVFAAGMVELSAVLEDEAATSIIINDRAPERTDGPAVVGNIDVNVDWSTGKITVNTYDEYLTEAEVIDAIENYLTEDLKYELGTVNESPADNWSFPVFMNVGNGLWPVDILHFQYSDDNTKDLKQYVTFTVNGADRNPKLWTEKLSDVLDNEGQYVMIDGKLEVIADLANTVLVESGADYQVYSEIYSQTNGSAADTEKGKVGTDASDYLAGKYYKGADGKYYSVDGYTFPASKTTVAVDDGYYKVTIDEKDTWQKPGPVSGLNGDYVMVNGDLTKNDGSIAVVDKDLVIVNNYWARTFKVDLSLLANTKVVSVTAVNDAAVVVDNKNDTWTVYGPDGAKIKVTIAAEGAGFDAKVTCNITGGNAVADAGTWESAGGKVTASGGTLTFKRADNYTGTATFTITLAAGQVGNSNEYDITAVNND